ncbi:MAG: HyaD/HybD family hydrogenase maturation endopeptidase [Nitrospirota bacterium]
MGINTAIFGIGNLLLGDEGAGIHAIRALRERYILPEGLDIVDGGTMGLDLLPYVEGVERLLIVDAIDLGAEPGTIKVLEGERVRRFLDTKFSVHQIGLPDMLFAAELKGILPPELCIVGIQPAVIETGLDMSEAVAKNFEALLDAVAGRLSKWGISLQESANVPGDTL